MRSTDRAGSQTWSLFLSGSGSPLRGYPVGLRVEVRERLGIEDLADLLFAEELPLAHDLEDPAVRLVGLACELARALVADHGIECRDDADRLGEVALQRALVHRDSVDAARADRFERVREQRL